MRSKWRFLFFYRIFSWLPLTRPIVVMPFKFICLFCKMCLFDVYLCVVLIDHFIYALLAAWSERKFAILVLFTWQWYKEYCTLLSLLSIERAALDFVQVQCFIQLRKRLLNVLLLSVPFTVFYEMQRWENAPGRLARHVHFYCDVPGLSAALLIKGLQKCRKISSEVYWRSWSVTLIGKTLLQLT